jgi:hypothetical protein
MRITQIMLILNATEYRVLKRMLSSNLRRLGRSRAMLAAGDVPTSEIERLLEPLKTEIRQIEKSIADFEASQKKQ